MIPLKIAHEIIRAERAKTLGLKVSKDEITVTLDDRPLSKGCQACKTASWICIYIGETCNLACDYCPQDEARHEKGKNRTWINGGNFSYCDDITLKDIDWVIKKNPQISGISFSGGEPFLFFDKVVKWATYFTNKYPQIYKWIYTNGVLPKETQFKELSKIGIDEIRFDGAATEYSAQTVQKIKLARKYFNFVCVETPALPWLTDKLHLFLDQLQDDLDYLNLHTLQVNKELNWPKLLKHIELNDALVYEDLRSNRKESLQSFLEVYKTIRYVKEKKYKIIINDCGSFNMANQTVGWQFQRNNCNGCKKETWKDFRERARKDGMVP